jgi:dipeptide transport system ATP-binding protein
MSDVLIEARNLARSYDVRRGMFSPKANVKAVADVSLTVRQGRTLAIVGESGCGKSTLARLLTMIERPSSGQLTIGGIDVSDGDAGKIRTLRQFVQIVFQNPYGSLNPRQKVGAVLEEPLIITSKATAEERRTRAMEMLAKVGLRAEHYHRYPHMFSGGQRQRIAIARALMLSPKVLVLDEPVSALDVSIRAQVLNLLADLKADFGLTYVLISHDLSVVRHVADDLMIMYLGRVVESGSSAEVFARPRHPYTQALLSATPVADPRAKRNRIRLTGELPSPINPPSGCAFHPRCSYAEPRCRSEIPLGRKAGNALTACHAVEEGRLPPLRPMA